MEKLGRVRESERKRKQKEEKSWNECFLKLKEGGDRRVKLK